MEQKQKEIVDLIPEGNQGDFYIKHFEMNEEEVRHAKMMAFRNYYKVAGLEAGKYIKLCTKHDCIMSNTAMEWDTNKEFMENAKGDILIAGLGIGLIVYAIQDNPEVKSITVIEKYQEVIDLVGKYFTSEKIKIIKANIFEWLPALKTKYDTIYFDIWTGVCGDNYPEMITLGKRFRKHKVAGGWIGSWRKFDCRKLNKE